MRAREVSLYANNTSKRDRKRNKKVNVITVTDRKLNEVEIEVSDFDHDYICIKNVYRKMYGESSRFFSLQLDQTLFLSTIS